LLRLVNSNQGKKIWGRKIDLHGLFANRRIRVTIFLPPNLFALTSVLVGHYCKGGAA
jgi:hypothetical protein